MSLALPPVPERDQQQLPDGVYEMTEPEADLESDAELSVPRFESDISLTEGGLADKYFLKYRSYHKPITILKPTDHCYGQGPSPSPGPAGSSGGVGGTEARHTLLVLHVSHAYVLCGLLACYYISWCPVALPCRALCYYLPIITDFDVDPTDPSRSAELLRGDFSQEFTTWSG